MRFTIPLSVALVASISLAQDRQAFSPDANGYTQTVAPFLATYCDTSHTGVKSKGEFATDAKGLPNDFLDLAAKGKWKEGGERPEQP